MSKTPSYFTKREDLVDKFQAASTSLNYRRLLLVAIVHTDLCMTIYDDLVTALGKFTEYIDSEKVRFNLRQEQFRARREEVLKHLREVVDEEIRAMISNDAENIQEGVKLSQEFSASYYLTLITDVETRIEYAHDSLFDVIFSSNETDVVWSAVKKFMEVVVGLLPIGNIIGGIQAINDILKEREQRVEAADTELGRLENYVDGTLRWSWATQILIDFMESLPQKQNISFVDSRKKVELRKQELMENLFRDNPEVRS